MTKVCSVFMFTQHLLTVPDTSPCHIHKANRPRGTHISQPPRGLHLMSFWVVNPDNTNHHNTLLHKPRLYPSGYTLVNLSITLKPLGPAVIQTQTHNPHSQNHKQRVKARLHSNSSQAQTRTEILILSFLHWSVPRCY